MKKKFLDDESKKPCEDIIENSEKDSHADRNHNNHDRIVDRLFFCWPGDFTKFVECLAEIRREFTHSTV